MKKTTFWRVLALLATVAMLAAACGGDDDGDTTDGTEAGDSSTETTSGDEEGGDDAATDDQATGTPETTELTLGLIPIADVAPVFIAIDRGLFEEEGLTVTTEFAAGGAAAIPALQAGEIDLAFGGYPSTFKAIEAGIPLVVTQEAVRGADLFAGFYSLPDSGIAAPADMMDKTVAVNTLNNIVQMALSISLQEAGLSLDDVTLVEIPFPDQVAALELGDVDVISVVEPFGTIARNSLDATLVADMFSGTLSGFPVAGWQVTQEFADANPNTIAAFNRAFVKATEIAVNEEGALAAIVPTYTSATEELAAELNYPNMVSGLDLTVLQAVPDIMVEQELLADPISVSDHALG
jgi:NitT/TauT family transport system substrate-binding protein